MNELKDLLENVIKAQALHSAILSGSVKGHSTQKVTVRPILTKQGLSYQITEQRGEKAFHRNVSSDGCIEYLFFGLSAHFKQMLLCTEEADYHILRSSKGKITILKKRSTKAKAIPLHNRKKNYLLPEGQPIDFLVKLGVMNSSGMVYSHKSDKFRQINRFLEIVEDTLSALPEGCELKIIDFGCGKAYLTYALYYYLNEIKKLPTRIIGLDLKEEVVAFCSDVAQELGYKELIFQVGDINGFIPETPIDMVICLHACDTATDAALENAIRWEAKVILAVPCCQHELYGQIDQPLLGSLLRHGVLRERFAALVTDAARAEILEVLGYRCTIMEFIDFEHTPKNLLIRALLTKKKRDSQAVEKRYRSFANLLQINPSLAKRFGIQ